MKTSCNLQPQSVWGMAMRLLGLLLLAQLAACASVRSPVPSSIVAKPTTAAPVVAQYTPPANGAIFQTGGYRGLFEDARARRVGDTLTITISENTSTVKAAASSGSKTGSFAVTQAPSLGVFKSFGSNAIKGSTANSFSDKDAESASNTFTGTLTVTITEVLSNGNFKVSGEKQLALDKGTEFIRISGVVNPGTLSATNTVASTQVADARIEYRTNSQIDQASFTQALSRMFLSILPF